MTPFDRITEREARQARGLGIWAACFILLVLGLLLNFAWREISELRLLWRP